MLLFLDTEFTGLQQNSQLISLALVAENNQWFYAEFTDFDTERLSDWQHQHVLPNLFLEKGPVPEYASGEGETIKADSGQIAEKLQAWLEAFEKIEIWADVPAYDWVFFCELFGGALHIPKQIFYQVYDLATLLKVKGLDPDIQREELASDWAALFKNAKHNALYDALMLKEVFFRLQKK